jgi:hypothetical protein
MIERKAIFKDLLRKGFEQSNPDRYIKKSEIPAGTTLVDPSTGEQYTIDEGGELAPAQEAQPETGAAPSSPEPSNGMPAMPNQASMSGGVAGRPY